MQTWAMVIDVKFAYNIKYFKLLYTILKHLTV